MGGEAIAASRRLGVISEVWIQKLDIAPKDGVEGLILRKVIDI